jgi:hypothetical protein
MIDLLQRRGSTQDQLIELLELAEWIRARANQVIATGRGGSGQNEEAHQDQHRCSR